MLSKILLLLAINWYIPVAIAVCSIVAAYFWGGVWVSAALGSGLVAVLAVACRVILGMTNVQ